ncbi:leucine-rich repeat protein [Muricauda sp. SCSIO 64092]|uniref:S8 family serine peptidase n=1 Tax=Allomuricauda sp. SCSIO 64092 TaxID=2908842 RepID=UPI001FF4558E|nr:S8 family serine peptidase [Muricauda sp. SCSIO 64092]UOY07247.1 leucine-rich repeat protein [Muricauda sp. SCSIO 64092]
MAKEFTATAHANKQKALALAKIYGWEPIKYNADGTFDELMGVRDDGSPIYYTLYNVDAARSTRTNHLNTGGSLNLDLNGQGMNVYVWDGGPTQPTHQEFNDQANPSRVIIEDDVTTLNSDSWHAQHVTGTILAAGVQPNAKGMAPLAQAFTHEWNNDLAEATDAAAAGMLLSNHSYGPAVEYLRSHHFGAYDYTARVWDELFYEAPYYLAVFAAGNEGHYFGNGFPLNDNPTFDKLAMWQTAKNHLVVANAQDANVAPNGALKAGVSIYPTSSQGPTDDFRIKPDITGNGTGVYSTHVTSDTGYRNATGTSMAAPNVTGSLLLLQQHYNNLNGSFMRAATLKGLALHTADDAGIPGPDAIFGWGLLNAKAAAQEITDNGVTSIIAELTLTPGQSYSLPVEADGINDLIASISWTDPPGTMTTGVTPNINTPALVNDLDIRVTQPSNTFLPYRLTGVDTNDQGDNTVDPFERIDISDASGIYTITVTHKGALTGGNQNYTLIVTGIAITFKVDTIEYEVTGRNPNTVRAIGYAGSGGDLIIPQTVTYGGNNFNVIGIGTSAFEDSALTSVEIPDGVESIGSKAFRNNQLTSVEIPGKVGEIHGEAFADNPITKVTAQGVATVPTIVTANTFTDRNQIDVVVPKDKEQAYKDAGWTGFKSITELLEINDTFIVDNITYRVTSIETNKEVTAIGYSVMGGTVTIPPTVDYGPNTFKVTAIGDEAFEHNQLTGVTFTTPSNVTGIGTEAFRRNNLTEVTIPHSVNSIGPNAFHYNATLEIVTVAANNPPALDAGAFQNPDRDQIDLIVPTGRAQDYKDADWTGFRTISDGSTAPLPTIGAPQSVDDFEPFTIKIGFDGHVTGFGVDDVQVSNATVSALTGSGSTYAATIVPTSLCNGNITIDVPANVATGVNSLSNLAAQQVSIGPVNTISKCVPEEEPLADFNRGFSPNGDGIGDTLVLEGLERYGNNVVRIYDLSHRLLFSAHYGGPDDAWDGTDERGLVPVGPYVCVIDFNEPGLGHEAKMIYVNY